jgi:uncharacterized protein YxjI
MKRFYLKQKIFAITDRYKVFDENQIVHYHIDSKLFSIHHKMDFYRTSDSTLLYQLKRQVLTLLPKYYIMDASGDEIAVIHKRLSLLSHRLDITSKLGNFTMVGDFLAHDFSVELNGQTVLDFHKKWISWGDSYEVTIYDDSLTEFLLALVILIDDCLHDENRRR